MAINSTRLAELDRQIKAAEDRYWDSFHNSKSNPALDARFADGKHEAAAARLRSEALNENLDVLRTKRQNVAFELPEDTGIQPPIDLEALVERRFLQMDKHWQNRFDKFVKDFSTDLGPVIKSAMDERIADLVARLPKIKTVEKTTVTSHDEKGRIQGTQKETVKLWDKDAADDVLGVVFRGVYQRAHGYGKGACVTHDGSMWVALQDTMQGVAPGTNAQAWQLAAKGGKPVKVKP